MTKHEKSECTGNWDVDADEIRINKFKEWELVFYPGSGHFIIVAHCPFCGIKLPNDE